MIRVISAQELRHCEAGRARPSRQVVLLAEGRYSRVGEDQIRVGKKEMGVETTYDLWPRNFVRFVKNEPAHETQQGDGCRKSLRFGFIVAARGQVCQSIGFYELEQVSSPYHSDHHWSVREYFGALDSAW